MKNLEEKIFRKETIDKYDKKILNLGSYTKITTTKFLMSRLFIELVLFITLLLIPKYGLIIAIVSCLLFHFLYEVLLLDSGISHKDKNIYEDTILFFEMVKLSLLSTNDIRSSFEIVANKNNSLFAREFKKSLEKNKYNNDLRLVLMDMQKKNFNDDIIFSLIDLAETNDYHKTIDVILKKLQEKDNIKTRQKYIKLPFNLSILSILIILIFILVVIFMPTLLSIIG